MAELASVYLITGTDRPKVTRALRRLRERVGEDATEIFSAHEAGGQSAIFVARHGDNPVTSGIVIPIGPAAPHVVATSYAGKGWLGANWFNANKAK